VITTPIPWFKRGDSMACDYNSHSMVQKGRFNGVTKQQPALCCPEFNIVEKFDDVPSYNSDAQYLLLALLS
jgi:hypothetical protein